MTDNAEATDTGSSTEPTQPTQSAAAENAQRIADTKSAARAAIMADDSIVVEGDSAEPEAEGDATPEGTADAEATKGDKPEGEPAEGEQPRRRSLSELQDLAAAKRQERQKHEAQRHREQQERDAGARLQELEARQRQLDERERRLREDPMAYFQQDLGLDPSVAAERVMARQLRPQEEQLREQNVALQARLDALEKRYETDAETRQRDEAQRAQKAQTDAVYNRWDTLSGNEETYPLLAQLPAPLRRRYGDYVADLLTEAGESWTPEDVAAQVEHDLAELGAKAQQRGGGKAEDDGKARGTSKTAKARKPAGEITNDLASESTGSVRSSLDRETRRQNALKEAARLGLK